MMTDQDRIKIAVQKKGRLSGKSLELLGSSGLDLELHLGRLFARCRKFPLDIIFLRDDDIPGYVQDGNSDLGIVGRNVVEETGARVERLEDLGFGRCELAIAGAGGMESWKKDLIDRLRFRIRSCLRARNTKYVMMNAPEASLERIRKALPGMKSPTVLPLARKGMIAVHSAVPEDEFWDIAEQLKVFGATDILVIPIAKLVF